MIGIAGREARKTFMGETMGKGKRLKEQRQQVRASRAEQMRRASSEPANVIVRCPFTDKFFPTGVAIDPRSFDSATFENNTTQCPHCRQMHTWGDSEIALDN
jgi:hypothetical protein